MLFHNLCPICIILITRIYGFFYILTGLPSFSIYFANHPSTWVPSTMAIIQSTYHIADVKHLWPSRSNAIRVKTYAQDNITGKSILSVKRKTSTLDKIFYSDACMNLLKMQTVKPVDIVISQINCIWAFHGVRSIKMISLDVVREWAIYISQDHDSHWFACKKHTDCC